ncbi:hypothetical protein CBR_g45746 [Chara braunii]|uniref:DDE Tnp4 domain-containing protein n=1 Tax=Chara braunii TaxID=69332 RepID=A0A388LZ44_CHABU|nr:hypothetical protein CBR_g45746 [Chara braunii]|eukprot:GBG87594.1 hypothetical protein CBR_g45746 [Chara braunii]
MRMRSRAADVRPFLAGVRGTHCGGPWAGEDGSVKSAVTQNFENSNSNFCGSRVGAAEDSQANRSAWVSIFRVYASCEQRAHLPARRIFTSGVRTVLWERRAAGACSAPTCVIFCGNVHQRAHLRLRRAWSPAAGLISGRVFGGCGRRHAVDAERLSQMDVRGCGHGLHEEEIDAVAMAVTAVVLNTMSNMSSSSRDMVMQLRKRRALLQSVAEAPDCVATCEAVVQLCAALSTGVFSRQTPHRSRVRHYVEKKVTHYRMPLPVEQVIAFTLYRWASGETYESGTSAFGIGRATRLQAVRNVTSALLQAYPDAIKWPVGRRRAQILRAFREKGFPNCFGAIDCTHIYIDKPAGAPSTNYYDRKQKFSVQAQVVVDLDLRILDVHVGYPGSVHDVRVLHNSQLWRRAETGELFDAPSENLPHGVVTRGYLLGDNGYLVAYPWIVQPYGGIDQGPDEERFDTW